MVLYYCFTTNRKTINQSFVFEFPFILKEGGYASNVASGTGNIGDYSFTYTYQHWLSTLSDTSKTNQSYTYVYSSSKELTQLNFPNTLQLHQTWTSKMLDLLTVTDATQQTTYLSSDATYNANEQMSEYDFSVNAGQNAFSEGYDLAYDSLGRLSTMETDSTSRTVTHGYDAGNGQLTSLAFSDLGTYSIDYLTNGNIDTITYPNSQGEETYTYGGGKGRLSQIEYPNDDTLEFDWNDKDEVSRITYTDYTTQTETRYTMTYTPNHEVSTLTQSIDSVQQYVWTFSWAPNGLEKAVKTVNGQPTLTQDFTTDPQGRILSMTYDTTGEVGYDGELYFHYDHFGNTTLLTDEDGDPVASFEYDLHSGKIINEWNPEGLEVVNLNKGRQGGIKVELPETYFIITNSFYINITEYTSITTTLFGKWNTNIGDVGYSEEDANACFNDCPYGTVRICVQFGTVLDYLRCLHAEGVVVSVECGDPTGKYNDFLGFMIFNQETIDHLKNIEAANGVWFVPDGVRKRCFDKTYCMKWGCSKPGGVGEI